MTYRLGLFAFLVVLLVTLPVVGVNKIGMFWITFVALTFGISNYFHSRKADAPSGVEAIAAFTWLFIRRLVCFIAAFVFSAAAIGLLFETGGIIEKSARSGIFLIMAIAFGWVGVYGQGWDRYRVKDDLALHKKNKERYKWRW